MTGNLLSPAITKINKTHILVLNSKEWAVDRIKQNILNRIFNNYAS